ncbi:hypothetical protein [Zobellia amurskyensis]|uniref:hypothetical protein n=1 Tax=Zobellia amurskyensis TaxID=248905 RepID=UPI000571BA84|nr:hypothetical protein [Zobellia amurskyensis]
MNIFTTGANSVFICSDYTMRNVPTRTANTSAIPIHDTICIENFKYKIYPIFLKIQQKNSGADNRVDVNNQLSN